MNFDNENIMTVYDLPTDFLKRILFCVEYSYIHTHDRLIHIKSHLKYFGGNYCKSLDHKINPMFMKNI